MSEKSSKKLVRNGQSMNNDDKKRSTEDKNSSKKNVEKKFQKEKEKQKKKIDWEEEKDVLKAYLHKTYSLNQNKVDRIIEEKAENYIDLVLERTKVSGTSRFFTFGHSARIPGLADRVFVKSYKTAPQPHLKS